MHGEVEGLCRSCIVQESKRGRKASLRRTRDVEWTFENIQDSRGGHEVARPIGVVHPFSEERNEKFCRSFFRSGNKKEESIMNLPTSTMRAGGVDLDALSGRDEKREGGKRD